MSLLPTLRGAGDRQGRASAWAAAAPPGRRALPSAPNTWAPETLASSSQSGATPLGDGTCP
eukprot:6550737-Pyramimonas_sp.AAC.1